MSAGFQLGSANEWKALQGTEGVGWGQKQGEAKVFLPPFPPSQVASSAEAASSLCLSLFLIEIQLT